MYNYAVQTTPMKTSFHNAAWRLNPAEIIASTQPPLPGFAVPDYVDAFYATLKSHQEALGRNVSGGFMHGGGIPDIARGKRPKDIDMYVCIPELAAALKKACVKPSEDDRLSLFGRTDRIEMAMGSGFPLIILEDLPSPQNNPLFGDYFEVEGYFHRADGGHHVYDLRVGSEPLKMEKFLSWVHAPVMAVAASLEEDGGFAYHKDMPDHHARRIMRIAGTPPDVLKRKAQRKGMTIEEAPLPPPPL